MELGCGSGGNTLSIASSLPGARIHGSDLSTTAIETAIETAAAAKLNNASFSTDDLSHDDGLDELTGQARYVIIHGLISWVPERVRRSAFETASRLLAPGGIAYVSYNALPGWNLLIEPRRIARAAVAAAGG